MNSESPSRLATAAPSVPVLLSRGEEGLLFMEEWKPVIGYETTHEVSSLGRVRGIFREISFDTKWGRTGRGWVRVPERLLKPYEMNAGYLVVNLSNAGKYKNHLVHRLVCAAFHANPTMLRQVNHKNGKKKDNRSENLEWCSCSANITHAYRIGLRKPTRPQPPNDGQPKLTPHLVKIIRAMSREGRSQLYLSKLFRVSNTTIHLLLTGRTWSNVS